MKDRRKRDVVSWNRFFWVTVFFVFSGVVFTGFTFSTFRLLFGETYRPVLVSRWRNPAMEAISGDSTEIPAISIRETVMLPDQVLVFLKYPPSARVFTKEELDCVYFSGKSSEPEFKQPPASIDGDDDLDNQIVRCPLQSRGFTVSIAVKSDRRYIPAGPTHRWDSLVYDALIDRDNSTVVFVKGINQRPERVSNSSKFECVYGWDFRRPRFLLRSEVLSIAQEIVRCKTPLSILSSPNRMNKSVKVSIRVKGRGTLHSIARPKYRTEVDKLRGKQHEMCICTMLRNQARFLREWVMYHSQIGVQRWFIYDNNSEDYIESEIEGLQAGKYNITRHVWPWIKTQEAGFAHCALRAREFCEWVGFIDVDEFFHLPTGLMLTDFLRNQSQYSNIAELRVSCHSFGPSGLKRVPEKGVTVGYTCRMAIPERHKSIVKPEALNSTLINVVHHFHLMEGFDFMNVDRADMVINHYKYQVWEVFKEKFYRRVATYVVDWQEEQNVGSKDRAPGLGTRAVEPVDWSSRFCEVADTGLKDRVLQMFTNMQNPVLPWQEEDDQEEKTSFEQNRKAVRKHRSFL